jgi:hypothetical protein
MPHLTTALVTLCLATAALAAPAAADPAAPAAPALRADIEVDPTAYVLDGHSIHAGIERGRWRLDLGAFALAIPASIHGNEGFAASFDGFGAKLQYFVFAEGRGGFVGVDAAVSRLLVELDGTNEASRQRELSVGVNLGWRFPISHGVYATPWLGLGRTVAGGGDVMLGGRTFSMSPWTVFPAVHVGRRF